MLTDFVEGVWRMSEASEPIYRVVVNHEEQYSIWPAGKDLPAGWSEEGKAGVKEECLNHIDRIWVDMRPRSLRERMDQQTS